MKHIKSCEVQETGRLLVGSLLSIESANFADAAPRNVSVVRGAPAALACEARGDSPLGVQWTHRGASLALDSPRYVALALPDADSQAGACAQ